MNRLLLAAALLASSAAPSAAAVQITVNNVGSILNESLSLPAQDTPGLGIGFEQFFEFSLPVGQNVTLSMTDSATGFQRITGGVISLNHWTSTSGVSPFVPLGALIESAPIVNLIGGQTATVTPDFLGAGTYFAEVSGTSGLAAIHIAVDSTITASPVPEAGTWAMLVCGFALLIWKGFGNGAKSKLRSPDYHAA